MVVVCWWKGVDGAGRFENIFQFFMLICIHQSVTVECVYVCVGCERNTIIVLWSRWTRTRTQIHIHIHVK